MQKKCPILVKRSLTVWEKPYQPCLVATVFMQKATLTTYWKSRDNANLMRLKVAKCVKILILPPIERAVKVWEKSTHCLLEKLWEQMEKNHNHSLLNKRWSIRNTIIMGTMRASVLTYLLFRHDNIYKIASIEQWSPAVSGKPILFHIERAVSRNLSRSSDCNTIAYWESNDSSTKHILFLRNGW